jgi:hypothetical protein
MSEVIGVLPVEGEYEGHSYHKLNLHVAEPMAARDGHGQTVSIHRLNWDVAQDLLAECGGNLELLIGRRIEVYYNKFKKPVKVDILA